MFLKTFEYIYSGWKFILEVLRNVFFNSGKKYLKWHVGTLFIKTSFLVEEEDESWTFYLKPVFFYFGSHSLMKQKMENSVWIDINFGIWVIFTKVKLRVCNMNKGRI